MMAINRSLEEGYSLFLVGFTNCSDPTLLNRKRWRSRVKRQ